MPCRPGPTPVSAQVWFTSVTLGNSAIAPPRSAQPRSSSRATFGSVPSCGEREQVGAGRAVPQQADDVRARPARRGRAARRPSRRTTPPVSAGQRRGDVDGAGDARPTTPRARTPGPDSSSGARDCSAVERAVLAEVAAALGPVVRAGVHDGEVGCARVAEQRVQPDGGEGVAVVARTGPGRRPGRGRRAGCVVPSAARAHVTGAVGDVHQPLLEPAHQVDDVRERRVEQDVERAVAQRRASVEAGADDGGAGGQVARGQGHARSLRAEQHPPPPVINAGLRTPQVAAGRT